MTNYSETTSWPLRLFFFIFFQLMMMTNFWRAVAAATAEATPVEGMGRKNVPHPHLEFTKRQPMNKGFLDIKMDPQPLIQVKLHTYLVLICQASGSPCPTIRWLVNGQEEESLSSSFGVDTNSLTQTSWMSSGSMDKSGPDGFEMATVTSSLQLPCIRPEQEAKYSCVVDSGRRSLCRSTRVQITEDDPSSSSSTNDLSPQCEVKLAQYFEQSGQGTWDIPARVMTSESLHMAPLGRDVLLPCRAVGQPTPKIIWTNGQGQEIDSFGTKFQVLSNGDLLVRDLEWSDMGEFVCSATNKFATHSAHPTFLYPLIVTSEEEEHES